MDNSPAWDGPLARVPVDPLPAYERRDTGHVDASQRPRPAEYDRYLTLVYRFRARAYEPQALYAETPFRIADVGVNSILHRADRDLLALAQDLGVGGRDELEGWIERGRVALQGLWSEVDGGYRSRDQLTGEALAVGTSASFLPLFAGAVPPERAPRLVATLERWAGQVRFLVPEHRSGKPLVRAAALLARAGLADRELDDRGRARRLRPGRSRRAPGPGCPGAGGHERLLGILRSHDRRRPRRRRLHLDRRRHAVLVAGPPRRSNRSL